MKAQNGCQSDGGADATFTSSIENNNFGFGYSADDITNAFIKAVESELAESQKKGFPIAKYDVDKKQAYLEFAVGTKQYINA